MDFIKAIEVIESNYPPENYTQLRKSLDMAISALGKQIPKRPEKHTAIRGDIVYLCPTCNRLYWERDHISNYCDSCGQRFELKKEEE